MLKSVNFDQSGTKLVLATFSATALPFGTELLERESIEGKSAVLKSQRGMGNLRYEALAGQGVGVFRTRRALCGIETQGYGTKCVTISGLSDEIAGRVMNRQNNQSKSAREKSPLDSVPSALPACHVR